MTMGTKYQSPLQKHPRLVAIALPTATAVVQRRAVRQGSQHTHFRGSSDRAQARLPNHGRTRAFGTLWFTSVVMAECGTRTVSLRSRIGMRVRKRYGRRTGGSAISATDWLVSHGVTRLQCGSL